MAYFIINLATGEDVFGPSISRSCAIEQFNKIRASNSSMHVGIEARMRSK